MNQKNSLSAALDFGHSSTNFWPVVWAIGLGIGWLLPNHYPPWIAFHSDAWISLFFLIAAIKITLSIIGQIKLYSPMLGIALIALLPILQFNFDVLPYFGMAVIGSGYVLAFSLSMVLGSTWCQYKKNQGINLLFLAILFAAIVSVGMEFYQWLRIDTETLNLWILDIPDNRPFGNLAQSNQLATLLIWAVIATAWFLQNKKINLFVGAMVVIYILFGIALTKSRTAFVMLSLAVPFSYWLKKYNSNIRGNAVSCLYFIYIGFIFLIPWITENLYLEIGTSILDRETGSLRIAAYRMFMDAAISSPWSGYGWSNGVAAQLAAASRHPPMDGIWMYSHNLFLDLIVWCGIPIGLALIGYILYIFSRLIASINSLESALLMAFVFTIGWHAMLELPLYYAYFLLPTGLVLGVLIEEQRLFSCLNIPKRSAIAVLFMVGLLTVALIYEYLHAQEKFYTLRFERARIGHRPDAVENKLYLLDQMDAFIDMGRTNAREGMTETEISALRRASYAYPSLANFYTLITALTLNNRLVEAQGLIDIMPKITTSAEYSTMRAIWREAGQEKINMSLVKWE